MFEELDFEFNQYEIEILFWTKYWALIGEAKEKGGAGFFETVFSLNSERAVEVGVQNRKIKWINGWAKITKSLLGIGKEMSEDDVMRLLRSNYFSSGKLLAFTVEFATFTAYFQLEKKDDKHKGLDFRSEIYLDKMAKVIPVYGKNLKKCRELFIKSQKNMASSISGSSNMLTWISIAAVIALLLAPYLGAAIGGLMGLSGAAATSAGLAFLGGGAISVGGLGMAGGAVAVMAGGSMLAYASNSVMYKDRVKESSAEELLVSCAKLFAVMKLSRSGKPGIMKLCDAARVLQSDMEKEADELFVSKNKKEGEQFAKKAAILVAFRRSIRDYT